MCTSRITCSSTDAGLGALLSRQSCYKTIVIIIIIVETFDMDVRIGHEPSPTSFPMPLTPPCRWLQLDDPHHINHKSASYKLTSSSNRNASDFGDFLRRTFLDHDLLPTFNAQINRRAWSYNVERHSVMLGQNGDSIGADFVSSIAICSDSIGSCHDRRHSAT